MLLVHILGLRSRFPGLGVLGLVSLLWSPDENLTPEAGGSRLQGSGEPGSAYAFDVHLKILSENPSRQAYLGNKSPDLN